MLTRIILLSRSKLSRLPSKFFSFSSIDSHLIIRWHAARDTNNVVKYTNSNDLNCSMYIDTKVLLWRGHEVICNDDLVTNRIVRRKMRRQALIVLPMAAGVDCTPAARYRTEESHHQLVRTVALPGAIRNRFRTSIGHAFLLDYTQALSDTIPL
jgi:hypothetical protein